MPTGFCTDILRARGALGASCSEHVRGHAGSIVLHAAAQAHVQRARASGLPVLGACVLCPVQALAAEADVGVVVLRRYVGNTYYNIYNKKACAAIHAHWTVAFAQVCAPSTSCRPCCRRVLCRARGAFRTAGLRPCGS